MPELYLPTPLEFSVTWSPSTIRLWSRVRDDHNYSRVVIELYFTVTSRHASKTSPTPTYRSDVGLYNNGEEAGVRGSTDGTVGVVDGGDIRRVQETGS
jgi:hypothetical protein